MSKNQNHKQSTETALWLKSINNSHKCQHNVVVPTQVRQIPSCRITRIYTSVPTLEIAQGREVNCRTLPTISSPVGICHAKRARLVRLKVM